MKTYTIAALLCSTLPLPSTLAAPSTLSARNQVSLSDTCSTANGIRRCCPGSLSMQVINGNLAGRCCVPVKNNKRDNNDRAAAMHLHARSHVVARDDGIESCPQGQVAVPVAAPDYDKQIADLMGKGKGKGGGGGGNPVSGGVDKGNPLALAGAMGILAAAGM